MGLAKTPRTDGESLLAPSRITATSLFDLVIQPCKPGRPEVPPTWRFGCLERLCSFSWLIVAARADRWMGRPPGYLQCGEKIQTEGKLRFLAGSHEF